MERIIVDLKDVDISNTPMFEEYISYKEGLNFENEHRIFARAYLPPEEKYRNEMLMQNLNKMPKHLIVNKADELIQKQGLDRKHEELIEHMANKNNGSYTNFSSLWSPILWQARETSDKTKVLVNSQPMYVFDLDFALAENLQQLYASEDPIAEYYHWVETQKKIEIDINTDGTTEDEIVARNSFISFLDDRETEMKRVMLLYAGTAFNSNSRQQSIAQEKLKFLNFKMSELRRLRERTQQTKSKADDQQYFEEKERRYQQTATNITTGLVAAEMLSLGNHRLQQNISSNLLEHGIGESFVRLRPETTTLEQAQEKISIAKQNREQMLDMFEAMRNGMSKDDWLKTKQNSMMTSHNIKRQVQIHRHFRTSDFHEYTNNMSA